MFSFLFEGKLGGILAPVGPLNQLFLAIQHRRDAEMQQIVLSNDVDISLYGEGGYAAVHVACQYGNQIALEVLLSRGVSIDTLDVKGNSNLHYAAKYGHFEMVRHLCDNGCNVSTRNQQQQTAYDLASHHGIRQYLLPLQMKSDANMQQTVPTQTSGAFQMHNPNFYDNPSNFVPPPPLIAPPSSSFGGGGGGTAPSNGLPHANFSPSLPYANAFAAPNQNSAPPSELGSFSLQQQLGAPPPSYPHSAGGSSSNARYIQPDGFHSSASDPALQLKYGHVKQAISTAPPPSGMSAPPTNNDSGVNAYSLFGNNQQGGALNRPLYPGMPYPSSTNSFAPPQPIGNSFQAPPSNLFSGSSGGLPAFYQPNQSANNTNAFAGGGYNAPPPVSQPFSSPFHQAHTATMPLENNSQTPPILMQQQQHNQQQPLSPVIFNPSSDTFVSANSSSNSVL